MFNKYPVNEVHDSSQLLMNGYEAIITQILDEMEKQKDGTPVLAIDGTNGADFQTFLQKVVQVLEKNGYRLNVQSTASYVKSGSVQREQFADNITDNRAFGFVTDTDISAYFTENAQTDFAHSMNMDEKEVCIVFGPGAYWLTGGKANQLYFLDLSRENQQVEYKKGLRNFAMDWNRDFVEKYKIAYFVEWPILEKYRKRLLPQIDTYIDMNKPNQPVSISGDAFKNMIAQVVRKPFRVKPFFAPGVWGGQRLKEMVDLPKEWVNCAWSFEPIAPENSILIGYEENVIEVPFLIVMALEYHAVMGERPVKLFGDYFPVRFDYLDTIGGSNLSCQVHPRQEYIREHFNEKMAQQESYYIMEKKGDAKVYLGLKEGTTRVGFEDAVTTAQQSGVPFAFTDYVNEFQANKDDLFLIPTGTVHCSGKDNLVLEISSTTWWFTFKIYDYLRKDLDGKPRPLNIEHGFENIDFYKTTDWVKENLIPEAKLLHEQGENKEYLLGQRDDLLFYVKRVHLVNVWDDHTKDEFVMLNLVEGEHVRIVSNEDASVFVELHYGESYILPSVFGQYKIENLGTKPCKLIKAGVSPDWNVSLIEN